MDKLDAAENPDFLGKVFSLAYRFTLGIGFAPNCYLDIFIT
jgi:hypothetical protein